MYSIYIKNNSSEVCIYNDAYISDSRKVASPKLDLIENSAGTFSFKLPPTNIGYDQIERLSTEIIVKKRGGELWSGRVLTIKEDFYKNRTYTCEGELAYLNDTLQGQTIYENINTYNYFRALLDVHNSKVKTDKKFTIGNIGAATTYESIYTNYDSTFKSISDCVNELDGYIHIRKENGVRYLDTISEDDRPTSAQEIRFGKNLLDFTKSFDSTDFCTVILPLGARLENKYGISLSGIDGVDAYTTIAEINGGSPYLVNEETVDIFGWIEKTVNFDDISDEGVLLELGKQYLSDVQFDNMVLEASAVDLGYLGVNSETIQLSEKVRVISRVHGLDRYFPVTKISIPLDNPANTTFTMGTNVSQSMSAKSVTGSNYIYNQVKNSLSDSSLLTIARTNANALINSFSTGYFTVTQKNNGSNEVYFTDKPISDGYDPENPAAEATRYWRWNLNGLGYYNKNAINKQGNPDYIDPTDGLRLALTMDGHIVADYITVGTLDADLLRTGKIMALNGDSYWDLDKNEFYLAGSTKYGDGTLSSTFKVTNDAIATEVKRASDAEGELSSKITQTSESISLEVSARTQQGESLQSQIRQNATAITSRVTSGQVESIIEQKADSIRLKSTNLVVESDNFKLDKDGNMKCNSGEFSGDITGGTINIGNNFIVYNNGSVQLGGDNSYFTINGTAMDGSRGGRINFNNPINDYGDNNLQLKGNAVVFSSNHVLVTESEGANYVSAGITGEYRVTSNRSIKFIHGIAVSTDLPEK